MRTGIQLLQQHGDVEEAFDLSPAQLCERIAHADALIIRSATQAREAVAGLCCPCMGVWCSSSSSRNTWLLLLRCMSRRHAA